MPSSHDSRINQQLWPEIAMVISQFAVLIYMKLTETNTEGEEKWRNIWSLNTVERESLEKSNKFLSDYNLGVNENGTYDLMDTIVQQDHI
ncbi:hypothetical protein TSUD_04790 [Trifolium subterraneum]|nr:hypothetical protein TSUD_04790 [Trifolium subterraneum]